MSRLSLLALLLCAGGLAAAEPLLAMTVKDMQGAAGNEGKAVDGTFRTLPVDGNDVHRLKIPLPAGAPDLGEKIRCVVEVEAMQATTVALMLVVQKPEGGWAGNLQGEQKVAAGKQTLTWKFADLKPANGQPVAAGRPGTVILMSWSPASELRLTRLAIGAEAK